MSTLTAYVLVLPQGAEKDNTSTMVCTRHVSDGQPPEVGAKRARAVDCNP